MPQISSSLIAGRIAPNLTEKLSPEERKQLEQAGEAFETMMLEKILASARTQDKPDEWRNMADRRFAEMLAKSQPLGVTRMITK